jgi:FlaA1/EpsC-like NDP-sugar epimerase
MVTNPLRNFAISLPRLTKQVLALLFDLLICMISVWLAFLLRIEQTGLLVGIQWFSLFLAVIIAIPLFIVFGFYRTIFRYVGAAALISMLQAFLIYTALFSLIFTVIGVAGVPRAIGVIQPILFFIGVSLGRYAFVYWLNFQGSKKSNNLNSFPRMLIYGAGTTGRHTFDSLRMRNEALVYGFIDDDPRLQGGTINGLRIYKPEDFSSLISKFGITDLLIAIPSLSRSRKNEVIDRFGGQSVRIRAIPETGVFRLNQMHLVNLQDLDMSDLLGREVVKADDVLLKSNIFNKVVLVTGAGGSIGSELCRQILSFLPKKLILLDVSEFSLYTIHEELKQISENSETPLNGDLLVPILGSLMNRVFVDEIFSRFHPDTVFHAAAYKHVPLVESNFFEGILNNVLSTDICVRASIKNQVSNFILISTDKAVRPTNIMGASKRIAELILQANAQVQQNSGVMTKFSMVRFGNVLGSSGSVAPVFIKQIEAGGPLTLTHLEVTRFFMTIPEAAQLVIQASAMSSGGEVFILDMGESVRIYDLALRLILLAGLAIRDDKNPMGDIEIRVTGLRPGEKLYEELLLGNNPQPTIHPKIQMASEEFLALDILSGLLDDLYSSINNRDTNRTLETIKKLVPDYSPQVNAPD